MLEEDSLLFYYFTDFRGWFIRVLLKQKAGKKNLRPFTLERRLRRRFGAVHRISFYGAVREAQRESCIGVLRFAKHRKARFANLLTRRGDDALDIVVKPFTQFTIERIDFARKCNQRVNRKRD